MFTISKRFAFSAAHHLPWLPEDHPCHRVHGHNYEVTIEVRGHDLLDGFVLDYRALAPVKDWIDATLDHRDLNEVWSHPTAELMAQLIAARAVDLLEPAVMARLAEARQRDLPWQLPMVACHVSETPKTLASWTPVGW